LAFRGGRTPLPFSCYTTLLSPKKLIQPQKNLQHVVGGPWVRRAVCMAVWRALRLFLFPRKLIIHLALPATTKLRLFQEAALD
jgi:hypothetical protein